MDLRATQLLGSAFWEAPVRETDVLVIGGGVAGFSASIAASPSAKVICVTKDTALVSNTGKAQGGVAAVLSDADSIESHRDDTLVAGCGLCDEEIVEAVVREGPERVRDLIDWGGHFDQENGRIHLTLEGGHSSHRVAHARGDQTGMEIQSTLYNKAKSCPGVEIIEHAFALDLIDDGERCIGALVQGPDGKVFIRARATILATGGGGQLYRESTNPKIATADGFAMALRAGVPLRDMEFIQFHPTTLYIAGSARHLITEAVRGEGGVLRDMNGERFMVNYHPDAELAPRDVVSRGIIRHMAVTGNSHMFLDLSHLPNAQVKKRFPKLNAVCQLYNIDVSKSPIPIHPSVHYMMGGIRVDYQGRTSMPGLYASGEVSSTGLHGANRLASNSLLEGLVFGYRSGHAAALEPAGGEPMIPERDFKLEERDLNAADMFNSIRSLMWKDVGILRSGAGLQNAVDRLEEWAQYVLPCRFGSKAGWELVNILSVAYAVASSALTRQESRGAHFRSDFPEPDESRQPYHSLFPLESPR